MRCIVRKLFIASVVFLSFLLVSTAVHADPFKFSSSTQFLWGDDLLGDRSAVIAQYLRFTFAPEGKPYSVTGYGRLWKDLGSPEVRSDDFETRVYYLYLDYALLPNVSTRIGRQFTNFTAGTSIMDGIRLDVNKIGPVGVTLAGGRDVTFSLDGEYSRNGNNFFGIDIHLQDVKSTQLGFSYVRRYDESDLAREELGMNFRYFLKFASPYAEVKYDLLSKVFDDATIGVDVFPLSNLKVKAEFYHSYPTFDSTSIYSVFAVDKFREYLILAEYNLAIPVSVFASYKRQTYEEDTNADVYTIGARAYPNEKLNLNASFDYRRGYSGYAFFPATGVTETDGKLYGFELSGDYKLRKEIIVFAGIQYDTYNRPDISGNNYARRYWAGGRWIATKKLSVTARLEDDDNPNFSHRILGRVALDWNL
jgi:hypothetical protein